MQFVRDRVDGRLGGEAVVVVVVVRARHAERAVDQRSQAVEQLLVVREVGAVVPLSGVQRQALVGGSQSRLRLRLHRAEQARLDQQRIQLGPCLVRPEGVGQPVQG